MERLLDIKDAAELLKVSEKSIRRWTNSGTLKCYRVGGKRERRFHMKDLEEFLQDLHGYRLQPSWIGGGPLVHDGSHMAHFYSGKDEAIELSASCVLEGLKQNEIVLVVMPPEGSRGFMSNLERRGVPIEKAIQEGRLNFTTGMDTPGEMIRYLAGFVEKTDKFRVMGDMSWALEKGWDLAALRALEKAADFMPRSSGRTLLCQYSLEDFSGAHVMMAAELHRQIIYKGRVEKSPYHNTHLPQRH